MAASKVNSISKYFKRICLTLFVILVVFGSFVTFSNKNSQPNPESVKGERSRKTLVALISLLQYAVDHDKSNCSRSIFAGLSSISM